MRAAAISGRAAPAVFDGSGRAQLTATFEPGAAPAAPSFEEGPAKAATASLDLGKAYEALALGAPGGLSGLDKAQRAELFKAVYFHRVAALDKVPKYDPGEILGFCFGRAMAAHLLARLGGLDEGSIRKLFIVGDMREGADPEWRFHVAALVRGTDARWYAVDPVMKKPLEINAWIRGVRAIWDKPNKTKLYLVRPSAVLPDLRVVPDPGQETGERLIELSFDPASAPGFEKAGGSYGLAPDLAKDVYEPSQGAADRHFMDALAGDPLRFDFEAIEVNGERIGYNGYFRDLLADLSGLKPPHMDEKSLTLKFGSKAARLGLGSMRIKLRGSLRR